MLDPACAPILNRTSQCPPRSWPGWPSPALCCPDGRPGSHSLPLHPGSSAERWALVARSTGMRGDAVAEISAMDDTFCSRPPGLDDGSRQNRMVRSVSAGSGPPRESAGPAPRSSPRRPLRASAVSASSRCEYASLGARATECIASCVTTGNWPLLCISRRCNGLRSHRGDAKAGTSNLSLYVKEFSVCILPAGFE